MNTWHHYCVTYAAEPHPKEKDRYLPGNVTLYVDGRKEGFWKNATVNTSLGSPLYIGADIHGSKTLDGAVDEVYVYDKALEAWQVEVLHGILSPPTVAPSAAPTPDSEEPAADDDERRRLRGRARDEARGVEARRRKRELIEASDWGRRLAAVEREKALAAREERRRRRASASSCAAWAVSATWASSGAWPSARRTRAAPARGRAAALASARRRLWWRWTPSPPAPLTRAGMRGGARVSVPVSNTHLTLPTKRIL